MATSKRDRFINERGRVADLDDDDVRTALLDFADALDPEIKNVGVPEVENGTVSGQEDGNNSTAATYLLALRVAYIRHLDLLGADAETINRFMQDLVADPEHRRYDLVGPSTPHGTESPSKPTAANWQSALRAFYRFCTEPGKAAERPDVTVEWKDVNGSQNIHMFSETPRPKHEKEEGLPRQADLDAMREACVKSQNPRRDRAFLELAAGTGLRVYPLVTLRVKHVHLDGDCDCRKNHIPHVLLNPEIDGDGDKDVIERTGRWKPIVTDTRPIREWIRNHPMQDPDVRAEHGAPDDFEDCYLFLGSLIQRTTDPADHWDADSAHGMLERRKAATADLPRVETVDREVYPHAWRGYVYTKSQELPIDESVRRKALGWAKGSDTGSKLYSDREDVEVSAQFADAWRERFGDADTESVAEQIVGDVAAADLPPEARRALVRELIGDDAAMEELAAAVRDAAD